MDVEVTAFTKAGRKITRVANVDPNKLPRRVLVVKLPKGIERESREARGNASMMQVWLHPK